MSDWQIEGGAWETFERLRENAWDISLVWHKDSGWYCFVDEVNFARELCLPWDNGGAATAEAAIRRATLKIVRAADDKDGRQDNLNV